MDSNFKQCPSCRQEWKTQEDYICDEQLEINGYSADLEDPNEGLFFFTHNKEQCYSTMAIKVQDFVNLYDGPFYSERKNGSDQCPEYCLKKDQLDRCVLHCECAYVREIIQIIKDKHQSQMKSE